MDLRQSTVQSSHIVRWSAHVQIVFWERVFSSFTRACDSDNKAPIKKCLQAARKDAVSTCTDSRADAGVVSAAAIKCVTIMTGVAAAHSASLETHRAVTEWRLQYSNLLLTVRYCVIHTADIVWQLPAGFRLLPLVGRSLYSLWCGVNRCEKSTK